MKNKTLSKEFFELVETYPAVIKDHLNTIFTLVLENLDLNNLVSILFIGSGARGELSFRNDNTKYDIFSDYEFVIIVKKALYKSETDQLNSIFRALENKWNIKSPLFHIDYGVSTFLKFKNTPMTLWAFEAKNMGIIVYGQDVRKNLKQVTVNNLDYGNLNELIIVRLWNMLIHINNGFIKNENNEYENFIIKFYYARNILDILTILLPHYNTLIGGYKNRTQFFLNEFENKNWIDYKYSMKKVTDLKVDLKDNLSLDEAQSTFYNSYLNLVADISSIDCTNKIESLEYEKKNFYSNNIFKENITRTLRRKFMDMNAFIKYYKFNPKSLYLFFNENIKINLLLLLLNIHKSMQIDLPSIEKINYLKKSVDYFNIISFHNKFNYNNNILFEDNFIEFRYKVLDFMIIWFYSRSNTVKEDIIKNMNWADK